MSIITIRKASLNDAVKLTEIKKRTFDKEAEKWLEKQPDVTDYNIQPPGYASIEMTNYMIRELSYFKILLNEEIAGGIIVTVSGKSYGRIDRIFVDPIHQGKGIGSQVIDLIEEAFPEVKKWDLETSSRQLNNHHFYEKKGYRTTFETEDEFCYEKQIKTSENNENLVENKQLTNLQYEHCDMAETECYGVNLEGSSFTNSNLMKNHISNCNLSQSTYQNINFRSTLFADLNFSNSKFALVTLSGVQFTDTNLGDEKTPMTFERCDLEGAKLKGCSLKNVEIQSSDMTGMIIDNIPVEDLLKAYQQMKQS